MSLAVIKEQKRSVILSGIRTRLVAVGLIPPRVEPVLFGSFSKGNWDGRSDIDIALVLHCPESEVSDSVTAFFEDSGTRCAVDILPISAEDLAFSGLRFG